MDEDYLKMLELMEISFRDFEAAIPEKPKLVRKPYGEVYRFQEQNIYQAIIQKLAHAQSTLRAAQVLLENGYVQEQGALQRVLDEANEDILFLVYAVTNDRITELHEEFLDAFWEEEFNDAGDSFTSEHKRPMVSRKKIRAYIAKIEGVAMDPSRGIELARTINKAYSGFVHGASPHIMDRYGGQPPKFHIKGMLGTPRIKEHADDLWNYMYRTYVSHILVAKALGADRHVEIMTKYLRRFEDNAGKDYDPNA